PKAVAVCSDPAAILHLSVASAWEIQIKVRIGKLTLPRPLADMIDSQRNRNGLQILSATLDHVLDIEQLPSIHKDPFDRLIIAQARVEGAVLVSGDPVISRYPVKVEW
ncbi:MAG TPA: type II toxin-antitoxin system VapC family toxin, partial [Gemmataceae bacterium]|nr:type II toxin-antitoxin system VapC family toxin [Gemmataceae bacterium]